MCEIYEFSYEKKITGHSPCSYHGSLSLIMPKGSKLYIHTYSISPGLSYGFVVLFDSYIKIVPTSIFVGERAESFADSLDGARFELNNCDSWSKLNANAPYISCLLSGSNPSFSLYFSSKVISLDVEFVVNVESWCERPRCGRTNQKRAPSTTKTNIEKRDHLR